MRNSQPRFSIDSETIRILSCPDCKEDKDLTLIELDNEFFLSCRECDTLFPVKDVVYFTEKCSPRKCKLECSKACAVDAFYFKKILPGVKSKRIHINDSCIHCGRCADACPLEGLVKVKTPVFYQNGKKVNRKENTNIFENTIEYFEDELRPLDEKMLVPATRLTFEHLAKEMRKLHKGGILLDDGCGSQNFKAYIKRRMDVNVLGTDVRADHYAYHQINIIADGEHLPIKSKSISLLTSNFVLEHTTDPKKYLSEAKRVLKKGAHALISVPTPAYHIAYLLCLEGWKKYILHIVNNPLKFLKNPIKHFLTERAHEKDWSVKPENETFLAEMNDWKLEKRRRLFEEKGFMIKEEELTGNLLSLNRVSGYFLCNLQKFRVHVTYILV